MSDRARRYVPLALNLFGVIWFMFGAAAPAGANTHAIGPSAESRTTESVVSPMSRSAGAVTMNRKEVEVHIVMLSLLVALGVCVLLLLAFGVFTATPFGRHLEDPRAH